MGEEAQRRLKELQDGKATRDKTASEMSEKEKAAESAERAAKDKAAKANQTAAADHKAAEAADEDAKNAENQSKTIDGEIATTEENAKRMRKRKSNLKKT